MALAAIFSSDNGPVLDDGYVDEAVEKLGDHQPAGSLRGGKYCLYEAGTRVPFIIKWPAQIKPATTTHALVSQVDFVASFAALTGQKNVNKDAPDSQNVWNALTGKSKHGRTSLITHAGNLSLIKGDWKYIEPAKESRPSLHRDLGSLPLHSYTI